MIWIIICLLTIYLLIGIAFAFFLLELHKKEVWYVKDVYSMPGIDSWISSILLCGLLLIGLVGDFFLKDRNTYYEKNN